MKARPLNELGKASLPYLRDYQQHLRRRELAASTRDLYHVILKAYTAEVDWQHTTTERIERWLDHRKISATTRRGYIAVIGGFHAWAETHHGIPDPTKALVRPKRAKHLPRPIETKLLAKALIGAPTRMRAWLCLGGYAGLRCKEIAGLRVEDLHLDRNPPVMHLKDTKGDKDRVVPIADEVMTALDAYGLPTSGYVFTALDNTGRRSRRKLGAKYVSQEICKYLRDQGAVAHQLRHWFGTEVYRKTMNPLLVRDLMGHSTLATTSLYMALIPSEAATEAVRSLSVNE